MKFSRFLLRLRLPKNPPYSQSASEGVSCSQKNNHLKIINADCACDVVNALFQSRPNDLSKSTKDNWCRVCSCFPHFGDLNFQVFTLRAFFEYLNDHISVGWDCHFYNLAFLIVLSGLLANISLSV